MQQNEEIENVPQHEDPSEYRGHSLFYDVEDKELQASNRAAVMLNMYEQAVFDPTVRIPLQATLFGYFGCIPPEERRLVRTKFAEHAASRGYLTQTIGEAGNA